MKTNLFRLIKSNMAKVTCFFVISLTLSFQVDDAAKKTIVTMYYGVKINDSFHAVYNALNENTDCYDVSPSTLGSSTVIQAKAKASKTFTIGDNYSFPYIDLVYNFKNKKLVRRRAMLHEEKSKANYDKVEILFSTIATKSNSYTKEKNKFGQQWTEYKTEFLNKSGKVFAEIIYEEGVYSYPRMALQVIVYDSEFR